MPPIHRVKFNLNLQQFLVLYINKQSERGERERERERVNDKVQKTITTTFNFISFVLD